MKKLLLIEFLNVGCHKQVSEDNHNGIKWGNNFDYAFTLKNVSEFRLKLR